MVELTTIINEAEKINIRPLFYSFCFGVGYMFFLFLRIIWNKEDNVQNKLNDNYIKIVKLGVQ